jgi:hypothetical protein
MRLEKGHRGLHGGAAHRRYFGEITHPIFAVSRHRRSLGKAPDESTQWFAFQVVKSASRGTAVDVGKAAFCGEFRERFRFDEQCQPEEGA